MDDSSGTNVPSHANADDESAIWMTFGVFQTHIFGSEELSLAVQSLKVTDRGMLDESSDENCPVTEAVVKWKSNCFGTDTDLQGISSGLSVDRLISSELSVDRL